MYRKEVFVKEGLYDSADDHWSPEAMRQRLATHYRVGHIPIPFYRYQRDEAGGTSA